MQITITGPRGGGSTTIAAELTAHLRELGQEVRLIGDLKQVVEKQAEFRARLTSKAKIVIVVGVESEDEAAIRTRKAKR